MPRSLESGVPVPVGSKTLLQLRLPETAVVLFARFIAHRFFVFRKDGGHYPDRDARPSRLPSVLVGQGTAGRSFVSINLTSPRRRRMTSFSMTVATIAKRCSRWPRVVARYLIARRSISLGTPPFSSLQAPFFREFNFSGIALLRL